MDLNKLYRGRSECKKIKVHQGSIIGERWKRKAKI